MVTHQMINCLLLKALFSECLSIPSPASSHMCTLELFEQGNLKNNNKQPKKINQAVKVLIYHLQPFAGTRANQKIRSMTTKLKQSGPGLIQNGPAGLSKDEAKLEKIWFYSDMILIFHINLLQIVWKTACSSHRRPTRQGQGPTSETAVVGARRMCENKALRTLLTAGGQGATWRPLEAVPSVEVAASRPSPLSLAKVILVVLGEQGVEERIDATVAVGQTCGQIVNVALGLGGEIQRGLELTKKLPNPERQEAGPEQEHNGEDQIQDLLVRELLGLLESLSLGDPVGPCQAYVQVPDYHPWSHNARAKEKGDVDFIRERAQCGLTHWLGALCHQLDANDHG